mgnify:CR=1 FL=1
MPTKDVHISATLENVLPLVGSHGVITKDAHVDYNTSNARDVASLLGV